jgi:hypothetical protein
MQRTMSGSIGIGSGNYSKKTVKRLRFDDEEEVEEAEASCTLRHSVRRNHTGAVLWLA